MLKRFVLNALSSFVGAWIAIVICALGLFLLGIGIAGSFLSKDIVSVKDHSVLKITLAGTIDETDSDSEFDYRMLLYGKLDKAQNLKTLVSSIREAKTNGKIDALYISCEGVAASPATLDALRKEILKFKESGKRVFAYGDNLTMGDFFVASAADVLYLNPAGSLDIQGLNGTSLYFKDFLDKIGVEIQALRVGTFKSAVEPYISNQMSEPARMQLDSLYGEMWSYIRTQISDNRDVSALTIDSLVNKFIFLDKAEVAKKYKLVDDCLYRRQVMDIVANYVGSKPTDINFVSPQHVIKPDYQENVNSENQVAVVYAVGEIGEYEGAGINCDKLVPIIVKLAEDDNVKAMVLRVNSPGGSVFGSEQIGEALDYFKSKNKPLAVSMGDYAASGGYWISAGADYIYADPLTITGSIGIFGMVPNVEKLTNMIGVHPQTVGTNPGVMFPSIFYPMNDEQKAALQKNLDRGYEQFVNRVAKGRDKSPEYVKSIAEGRVWNAIKAKELGLVDALGGLQDAIDWVADKAQVKSPKVISYPMPEMTFWTLFQSSEALTPALKAVENKLVNDHVDEVFVSFTRRLLMQNPIQAKSPQYIISF